MLDQSRLIKISKYLSKHLRHQPQRLGLTLAPGGWVTVEELLAACAAHNFFLTLDELKQVVAHNDKQRFSLDSEGKRIRANQGHSIDIDLQLEAQVPPNTLYHGTAKQAVESILQSGLLKMSRHHVHLSTNVETARKVGQRHGIPVVFAIAAQRMHRDGFNFYCSENGVWLVDKVPQEYLLSDF